MGLVKHLLTRHYDPTRYKNQILDLENNILTVYLSNLSGQFVGFQQYMSEETSKKLNDPRESRYFTYSPRGVTAAWGLEVLDSSKKDLYVVEGIFKASSLHMLCLNAIAVLTSHPKAMKSWLHTLPYNLIGIGDGDTAGKGIVNVAGKGFRLEKDLDEYPLEELWTLLQDAQNAMMKK